MQLRLLVLLPLILASSPGFAFKGQDLAPRSGISIAKARSTALGAHPGTITDEELEREAGGSGLRYSFDIRTSGGVQEVGVDAVTGRLLENAKEGPNPD